MTIDRLNTELEEVSQQLIEINTAIDRGLAVAIPTQQIQYFVESL